MVKWWRRGRRANCSRGRRRIIPAPCSRRRSSSRPCPCPKASSPSKNAHVPPSARHRAAAACARSHACDRTTSLGEILMANILLAIIGWDPKSWDQRFRAAAPQHDIRLWPERVGDPADIGYACVWRPPHGVLASFRNLKAVFTLGAGVDDVLTDSQLPQVPIVRIVDPDLTMRMTEYVVLHVLKYHRQQRLYEAQQRERLWRDHEQPAASEVAVGVLGLGVLGSHAAMVLQRLGFRVAGWSRTAKSLPGVETFSGQAGLEPFVRRTEIMVCLLPATPETKGLVNLALLRRLKFDGALAGCYLINAGRGAV